MRSVVLRTLNRQRASILWTSFKAPNGAQSTRTLTPADVASKEMLFVAPNSICDAFAGRRIGRCTLGTSFRSVASQCTVEHMASALHVFEGERYVLFIAGGNGRGSRRVNVLVCFKDRYRSMDQLQAWIHAIEVARRLYDLGDNVNQADVLRSTLLGIHDALPGFIQSLVAAGWETGDNSMMFGSPNHLILEVAEGTCVNGEDKKER